MKTLHEIFRELGICWSDDFYNNYDRDTGKICITLQKDGETKIYRPTHKEMGL